MGYSSAEDRIGRDDFEKVVKVLCGPSPWQKFIAPNVKPALANSGQPLFQIMNTKTYTPELQRLSPEDDPANTPGVTDKKEGKIIMQDAFGQNAGYVTLGHALHEAVHLVSHPVGKSPQGKSTAKSLLSHGLFEGLTELVTEDILQAQGIALARSDKRGHVHRVRIVRSLFKVLETRVSPLPPVPYFGRLLFVGDLTMTNVVTEMGNTFTTPEWTQILRLANDNQSDAAIAKMNQHAAAQNKIHAQENEKLREAWLKHTGQLKGSR